MLKVFPFDDSEERSEANVLVNKTHGTPLVFDTGKFKEDPHGARVEMDALFEAMRNPETYDRSAKPRNALIETYNTVWFRVLDVRRIPPAKFQSSSPCISNQRQVC